MLVILLITGIWLYVFQEYFFFYKAFVFDKFAIDTISQFYPIEYFRLKNLGSGNFPFWSFQLDLGTNVFSIMANTNPFDLFFLLFGPDHFMEAMPVVILLKYLVSGIFFHAFLRRLDYTPLVSAIGTLLFVFSGYMVINTHWYHYANYTVFIAVFLYYFEVWFQQGRWLPLVLVLGLVALKGELQLFQMVCFGSVYVLYRSVNTFGWSSALIRVYIVLGCLFAAGLALGAYLYLPGFLSIFSSARIGGAAAESVSAFEQFIRFFQIQSPEMLKIFIARFFSPDLLGSWIGYKGNFNYFEDSTLYVGVISVLLVPLVFVVSNKKEKLLRLFPVLVFLLCLFPLMRSALNGFASGTFKYLALFCGFFILFSAMTRLNEILSGALASEAVKKINRTAAILLAGALSAFVLYLFFVLQFPQQLPLDTKVTLRVFFFSTCYLLLFLLFSNKRLPWIKVLLSCLIVLEVALFARLTVSRNPGALLPFFQARGENYFDQATLQAIAEIKDHDQTFYRMEKGYNDGHLNDPMVQDYFGTQSYFGFAPKGIVDFYQKLELSKTSPRLASYRYGMEKRSPLQSLVGVKYFLCRTDEECAGLSGFSLFKQFGEVRVYENDLFQPFGRLYYQQIDKAAFEQLPVARKDHALTHSVVLQSPLPGIPIADGDDAVPNDRLPAQANDYMRIENWNNQLFQGQVNSSGPAVLFFAVPHTSGWKVFVNGVQEELLLVNFGFSGAYLPGAGNYQVELKYHPPFLLKSLAVTLFSLLVILLVYRKYPVLKIGNCSRAPHL